MHHRLHAAQDPGQPPALHGANAPGQNNSSLQLATARASIGNQLFSQKCNAATLTYVWEVRMDNG